MSFVHVVLSLSQSEGGGEAGYLRIKLRRFTCLCLLDYPTVWRGSSALKRSIRPLEAHFPRYLPSHILSLVKDLLLCF